MPEEAVAVQDSVEVEVKSTDPSVVVLPKTTKVRSGDGVLHLDVPKERTDDIDKIVVRESDGAIFVYSSTPMRSIRIGSETFLLEWNGNRKPRRSEGRVPSDLVDDARKAAAPVGRKQVK